MGGRFLLLAAGALLYGAVCFGQLSPGDLHEVHKHLEGLGNCTQCHEIGNKDFSAKCLACHTMLKDRIKDGKGLHAQTGYEVCQSCHVDHHGRTFELVRLVEDEFEHDKTGYSLNGKHGELACRDCHKAEFIGDVKALTDKGKDPSHSFLGLTPSCIACHEDIHRGQLSESCGDCHQETGWRPVSGFDHGKARFILEGKHVDVDCKQCHAGESGSDDVAAMIFKPLAFDRCLDCHQDEHEGQLAQDCTTCHSVEGWKPVSGFSHNKARFSLTGKHEDTACESCHPQMRSKSSGRLLTRFTGMAFGECSDCHKDVHLNKLGSNCKSCHSTASWKNYRKDRFDHDKTDYPLTGSHLEVSCKACHGSVRKTIARYSYCDDCHKNVHLNQINHGNYEAGCESCHSTAGFAPAMYSAVEHDKTAFPLQGSHLAVPCIACHEPVGGDAAVRQFHFPNLSCLTCHADPHEGRADEAIKTFGAGQGCEACHGSDRWDVLAFPHDKTRFSLEGGHQKASCKQCHSPEGHGDAASLRFEQTSSTCGDCHKDPHFGQFKQQGLRPAEVCESCHVVTSWRPERFEHNTMSRFSLKGGHESVKCSSCHFEEALEADYFVRYKPLDVQCIACHGESQGRKERKP